MKKLMLLLVFLFSLGQSFAQVVYSKDNYFLTRTVGGSSDWSIAVELFIISVCLGVILFFAIFVSEDKKCYFGKEPSQKISIYHFAANLVFILTAIIYSNYVMTNFYLEMLITAGITIFMVSLAINKYHVWNISRYLAIQITSLIVASFMILCMTQSPTAMILALIPPLFIVASILYATDW